MTEHAWISKAWSGTLLVWAAWIPDAICLMVFNPQVPGWTMPLIAFGPWPLAFTLGWRWDYLRDG